MFVVEQLLKKYEEGDAQVVALLNSVELLVVPVVNPDGYFATWAGKRLHRKNMAGLNGVDLNRNFDFHWDSDTGTSRSPYSEVYKGPSAASEPETQAVVKFFKNQTAIVGAIDFHAYSQLVLRPYGYTSRELPPHNEQLTKVGDGIAREIFKNSRKRYKSIPSVALYPTSGTAFDWFYDQKDGKYRPYGYTIELRPAAGFGGQGFIINRKEIIPTGKEILAAMKFFLKEVVGNSLENK